MAFHLKPTVPAVEALTDGWRGLGGTTVAFHADGPRESLGTISLTGSFAGVLSVGFSRLEAVTLDDFAGLGAVHGLD